MFIQFKGIVITGKKVGTQIGFPTANIEYRGTDINDGTYKINIIIKDKIYHGAGVYRAEMGLFEAHIFDFSEDIYGKEIEIIILEKIRGNKKFESLQELQKQISEDIKVIKNNKHYILNFGTFDILHKGHQYFLNQSRKYGDVLVTIIATDKNVLHFKKELPQNNQKIRLKNLKTIKESNLLSIGEEINPMAWVDLYLPKVICLGYDQIGFTDQLIKYLKDNNFDTKVIRIPAFKPEIYKSSLLKNK